MILTECPSQKDISWCPKMDFCMILYETYFGRVIKSLMKSNHQLFQCWLIINLTHKKNYANFRFCRKLSLRNDCIDLLCKEFPFGENVYCILYNDLASLRYGSKDAFRLSFAAVYRIVYNGIVLRHGWQDVSAYPTFVKIVDRIL